MPSTQVKFHLNQILSCFYVSFQGLIIFFLIHAVDSSCQSLSVTKPAGCEPEDGVVDWLVEEETFSMFLSYSISLTNQTLNCMY